MNEDEYLALLRRSIEELPPQLYPPQPAIDSKEKLTGSLDVFIERRGVCEQCGKGFIKPNGKPASYYVPSYCSVSCHEIATRVPSQPEAAVRTVPRWIPKKYARAKRPKAPVTSWHKVGVAELDAIALRIREHGFAKIAVQMGVSRDALLGCMNRRGYRFMDSYKSRCANGLHKPHEIHAELCNAVDKVRLRSDHQDCGNQGDEGGQGLSEP